MDRAWGERSRLFARYTINDERTLLAGSFPALPTSESLRAQQASIGHTLTGASWVNETHFSFTRLRVFDLPVSAFGTNVLGQSGNQRTGQRSFYLRTARSHRDRLRNGARFIDNLPQMQRDNTSYFSSSFSRTQGRHTWKAGFQFTHFTMAYLQSQFARGNFIFNGAYTQDPANPNTTGDAFADFLLGFPNQTQREVGIAPKLISARTTTAHSCRTIGASLRASAYLCRAALRVFRAIQRGSRKSAESRLFDSCRMRRCCGT